MHERAPRTSRRNALGLAAALVLAACGAEETPGEPAAEAPPAAAAAPVVQAPHAASQQRASQVRTPPPGVSRVAPPAVTGELRPLLEPRPPQVPPEVARALAFSDPADDRWPGIARVQQAEALLQQELARRVASGPRDDDAVADSDLLPEVPGRGAVGAGALSVALEAVGYDDGDASELVVRCNVTVARRPDGAAFAGTADLGVLAADADRAAVTQPFQLDYALETRWRDVEGRLTLASARRLGEPVAIPVARGAVFEERTREAFGADAGFDDELMRGMDAFYFHSDRLSGYDLIGNHGMAVGDLDGDGWEDLYVCMPPGMPNRLYLRRPDGGVRDAAQEWGVAYLDAARSALIQDFDGDGRRDLALAVGPDVYVHWNAGASLDAPTLLQVPEGVDVFSMAAADYDGDGDLDVYGCRYSSQAEMQGYPTPYHDARNGAPNTLWRNDGARGFTDVTDAVGMGVGNTRYSFAAVWTDFDEDGDQDLYVANDFGRNHYWRNDGGRFEDVADAVGAADMAAGMGVSVGDVDNDGKSDLYVSNMYSAEGLLVTSRAERFLDGRSPELLEMYRRHARGNTLLVNRGDGTFEDKSVESGSARGGWAWGAQFLDLDNDGDLDLYSPNGFVKRRTAQKADEFFWRHVIGSSPADENITPRYFDAWKSMQYIYFELGHGWYGEERNVLLLADGPGRFVDASAISGADLLDDARSLVVLDWDRDGFQDLLLKNRTAPRLRLMRNRGHRDGVGAWLAVELAQPGTANLDAVGARVRVVTDRGAFVRHVLAGDGFLVQSSARVHFGLGAGAEVQRVEVRWPDGVEEVHEGPLAAARALRIVRGADAPEELPWSPVRALAQSAPVELVEPQGFSDRTVLFDKLPIAPLALPAFAGGKRRVADLRGRQVLVTLWSDEDEVARGQLEHFAGEIEAFDRSGLLLVPMSIDSGAALKAARRTCERLGLARDAGFVDGWTRQALEVLLLEVYHRPETNPVPTSLLIDVAGNLCVVYQGPIAAERVLADAEVLAGMDPRLGTLAKLKRGRWITPASRPRRDLRTMHEVFSNLGYPEFAGYYAQFLSR